jgi:hypothetical protein
LPELQAVADGTDDCELVTVLANGSPERAAVVASRRKLRAPVLIDNGTLSRRFKVDRTPTTFILNGEGHAVSVLLGGQTRESLARAIKSHR